MKLASSTPLNFKDLQLIKFNDNLINKYLEQLSLRDFFYMYKNKKIKNIISGIGFEEVNYYTRQVFPFKLFGIGSFLNLALEALFKFLNIEFVIKEGVIYDPATILSSAEGMIGPKNSEEHSAWQLSIEPLRQY